MQIQTSFDPNVSTAMTETMQRTLCDLQTHLAGLMTFSTRIFIHDLLPIIKFSAGFSLVQL